MGPVKHNSIQFSEAVSENLKYYVYRLLDPRNGETFYVGKGRGNRVFSHARGADQLTYDEDAESAKLERIRDIRNSHLDVLHVIHRHGLEEATAHEVEAALIDAYPGVANEQGGHGSGDRGPMHAQEIVDKYALPILDEPLQDPVLMINVNKIENVSERKHVLRQVCFAWRISPERAQQARYILAVRRGIVIGAFVAEEWLEATKANFPDLTNEDLPGRYGFRGHVAPADVWDRYVGERGRRIVNKEMIPGQNPIRYLGID